MKGFLMVMGAVALLGGLAAVGMKWMRNRNSDDGEWEDDYNPELAQMQAMRNGRDGSAMSTEQQPSEAMQH